ncbi:MAG: hypothetical protein HY908_13475 [Myxococcales bacterium]|nr:hypothetical protein [Myxococcales bacterium]
MRRPPRRRPVSRFLRLLATAVVVLFGAQAVVSYAALASQAAACVGERDCEHERGSDSGCVCPLDCVGCTALVRTLPPETATELIAPAPFETLGLPRCQPARRSAEPHEIAHVPKSAA